MRRYNCKILLLITLTLTISLLPLYGRDIRIWVYFSPSSDLSFYLIETFNRAKSSIDCAFYNIEDPNVTYSLIWAKNRGVRVRLVTDDTNLSNPEVISLINSGVKVIDDKGATGLMHNKFCIVDERFVLTGSYNLTQRGLLDDNNLIKIDSPKLSKFYLDEFNELISFIFGGGIKNEENKAYVGESLVEAYFAPEDNVKEKILAKINKAKESIHFAIFSFTDEDYAKSLIKRFKRGVIVEGIVDNTASASKSAIKKMYDAGIKVLYSHPLGNSMHHKFIIIDMEILITGSFNLSRRANKENDENILIIHDREVAQTYYAEFKRLYGKSLAPKDEKERISYVYTKPNPAVRDTVIAYNLCLNADWVRIRIFDVAGNLIREIDKAPASVGHNEYRWNLTNDYNRDLANGVYVIEVTAKINGRFISGFTKVAIIRR